jgi:hypothetical protein
MSGLYSPIKAWISKPWLTELNYAARDHISDLDFYHDIKGERGGAFD